MSFDAPSGVLETDETRGELWMLLLMETIASGAVLSKVARIEDGRMERRVRRVHATSAPPGPRR